MASSPDNQHMQSFRCSSTNRAVNILARKDTRTTHHIILWKDIQTAFENAKCVQIGDSLVPFMTDDNFEHVQPLRIEYQPDVELSIITEETRSNTEGIQEQLCQMQQQQQQGVDEMLRMQREALDSLDFIRNRIQAILTQTYELHEYPIPRLFIILPKYEVSHDKVSTLVADQFRLYFLCECGSGSPGHQIHLAKHEGYDLNKPNEFFERYGPYLITMLQMCQFGIAVTGMMLPFMGSGFVVNIMASPLRYFRRDFNPLVKSIAEYLQDRTTEQGGYDKIEALEGPELRKLMAYLKIKDGEHSLGNLYRTVTQEGHVKWVCLDHYRESYQESREQIHAIVQFNSGQYIEETGKIRIELETSAQAREFYEKMTKSRGIHELVVTLKWDAIMDDIQELVDAVAVANVVALTVDGTYFKNPAFDVINRKQRFNPLMWLAAKERIQYLRLRGFKAFFNHVNQLPSSPYPKLREFWMDSGDLLDRGAINSFKDFLKHNPPLTKLTLNLGSGYSLMNITMGILSKLLRLQHLTINYGEISMASKISDSRIQDVDLTVERVSDLSSNEFKIIPQDRLTRLTIKDTSQETEERYLVDILGYWTRLNHLRIGCEGSRALTIIDIIIADEGVRRIRPLRTFELLDKALAPFDESGECDDSTHITIKLSFTEDTTSFGMQTWIRLQNRTLITAKHPVSDFVRQYGWSIVYLKGPWTFSDYFAATLAQTVSQRECLLKTLEFDPSSLTPLGFHGLERTLKRLQDSACLKVLLSNLEKRDQVEKAHSLFTRYGGILQEIELHICSSEQWLPRISSSFPTRSNFPRLSSFGVEFKSRSSPSSSCISWVAAMVSAPPQSSASESTPSTTGLWGALEEFSLRRVELRSEEWRKVIEAIDFTALQHLIFRDTNFSHDQFKLLVAFFNSSSGTTLKTFDIRETDFVMNPDSRSILLRNRISANIIFT
ncbi:hypothetical protein B0O80DRAFT_502550 [Mortierella sp. GBAus27b]|nr:hypothetical protein BGX31_010681 [Mortierella sp. GBA43]KAI8347744.1 hypothetical protein B0O80DRAFT_502550 [Mortierella sp. GBAus27b]